MSDRWHKAQYEASLKTIDAEGPRWEDLTDEQRDNIREINNEHRRYMDEFGEAIRTGSPLPDLFSEAERQRRKGAGGMTAADKDLTWGDVFHAALAKGCDHASAATRANDWERRKRKDGTAALRADAAAKDAEIDRLRELLRARDGYNHDIRCSFSADVSEHPCYCGHNAVAAYFREIGE